MDRDSDGEIKIRFDNGGDVSSYIKTRDVWVVAAASAAAGDQSSGSGITVSGAGMTRFNGTYSVHGTRSEAPSYRKVGSDETIERNGGNWYFCVDYGSACYYKQTSGGDRPPEHGWERANSGEGSAPTLAYGSSGSGGGAGESETT